MSFHRKVGRNIRLEASNTVGKRLDEEFAQVLLSLKLSLQNF
jgi:hypothetical protein